MIKIKNIYSKGCMNCHYISLLMKKLNIYDDIEQIEETSNIGKSYIKEFNITSTPTLLLFNDKDVFIKKIENINKSDLVKIQGYIKSNT